MSTQVPPGVCLIHGSYSGDFCPACTTAVTVPPREGQPPGVPDSEFIGTACGHPASAIVTCGEGTSYCSACEDEARVPSADPEALAQTIRESLVNDVSRLYRSRAVDALDSLLALVARLTEENERLALGQQFHDRAEQGWADEAARADAAVREIARLTEERDEAKIANRRLVRINGGLRGKVAGDEDDHWCAVEGCRNEPTMYEFESDEFVCDQHIYYGAENPMQAERDAAVRDAATLREALEVIGRQETGGRGARAVQIARSALAAAAPTDEPEPG